MLNSARAAVCIGALTFPAFDTVCANGSTADAPKAGITPPETGLFLVPRTHRSIPSVESLRSLETDSIMRESFCLTFQLLLSRTLERISHKPDDKRTAWLAEARKELASSIIYAGPKTKGALMTAIAESFGGLIEEQKQIETTMAATRARIEAAGGLAQLESSERSQILKESERATEASRTMLEKQRLLKALRDLAVPPLSPSEAV